MGKKSNLSDGYLMVVEEVVEEVVMVVVAAVAHWPGIKHISLSPNDEWRFFFQRYIVFIYEFKPG